MQVKFQQILRHAVLKVCAILSLDVTRKSKIPNKNSALNRTLIDTVDESDILFAAESVIHLITLTLQ